MRTLTYRLLAIVLVATTLSGCGTVRQESATEWMKRQPTNTR